jgi:PAS domain S-box-containing protein
MLDIRTIVFSNFLTSIVCMLVIFFLWRQTHKRFAGTGFWVVNFSFQIAAMFLIVLRGSIPDWASMVLANTLALAGALLGYMGLERFVEKKTSQIHNYILLAAFACMHAYFTLFKPSLSVRNLNLSIGLIIIFFQCALLLIYRVEPAMRRLTKGVGMVFVAYCIVSIVRIAEFFIGPHPAADFFQSGKFNALIMISYQILFILLTYALALMLNKRLLDEVKVQEAKFSKAFHSSPYAIALTRLSDGKIVEVNEGFVNITGYNYEDLSGKTTIDLHLWDKQEDRLAVVNELARTGKVYGKELQFRKKSGEMVTGLFSAEIVPISEQKYVLSSINDITERKRAEEDREKLISELKEALHRVKTLSGMLPICSSCKNIRDDKGYWTQIEAYIRDHSEAEFTHGICPECMKKLYPDVFDNDFKEKRLSLDHEGKESAG